MTDADAFLDAIWAKPDDPTPRLVFADWLQENGEDEYAAFIRIGCEIEFMEPAHPDVRPRLRRERFELHRRLTQQWSEQVPGIVTQAVAIVSDAGKPSRTLMMEARAFLNCTGPWPFFFPSRLGLIDYLGSEQQVASCPGLLGISDLSFVGYEVTLDAFPPHTPTSDHLLGVLGRSTHLTTLRNLTIRDRCPSRRGLTAFAGSPLVEQLREFAFTFPIAPPYHRWVDIVGRKPPDSAIRDAISRFLDEYGEHLPAE